MICAKISFLPTDGVRDSLDSMRTRGGEAEYHGRQRADGSFDNFWREKVSQNISRKHTSFSYYYPMYWAATTMHTFYI